MVIEKREEILERIARGEKVDALAVEYDISPQTIYSWLHAERAKAQRKPTPVNINEQIDQECKKFVTSLKSLLLKQVFENLREV